MRLFVALSVFVSSTAFAGDAVTYGPFSYAHAPIESDRWSPPREIHGALVSTSKNVSCPQKEAGEDMLPAVDEDCLRLRVSGPKNSAKVPVVVFFPGRDLRSGSGLTDTYNGTTFAAAGMVFISVSYRVGPFGFLTKDGETVSRAIQDQLSALKWIKAQVSGFGGNPENLTLMAEGMGAFALRQMINSGLAPSGVNRVILLSPDSSPGADSTNVASTDRLSKLNAVSWQEALHALEGEKLSVLPSAPYEKNSWRGVRVLQTVVGGEPLQRICDAISFATELEKDTESFLYLLHGYGAGRGSELRHLFAYSGEGERLRAVFTYFIREGKAPPNFFYFPSQAFDPKTPKALHFFWHFQFPWKLEGC